MHPAASCSSLDLTHPELEHWLSFLGPFLCDLSSRLLPHGAIRQRAERLLFRETSPFCAFGSTKPCLTRSGRQYGPGDSSSTRITDIRQERSRRHGGGTASQALSSPVSAGQPRIRPASPYSGNAGNERLLNRDIDREQLLSPFPKRMAVQTHGATIHVGLWKRVQMSCRGHGVPSPRWKRPAPGSKGSW